MSADPWLHRWAPLIADRARTAPVLELGCGRGVDTAKLASDGRRVVAIDRSARVLAEARARAPTAEFYCQDIREPFPIPNGSVGVVVASLSLHYFAWVETVDLAERIRSVLWRGGILLCRLNSTKDDHFGACGHPRIAEKYYSVDGKPKRFFDRASIHELFNERWRTLAAEELVIDKYEQPKVVWEVVLERGRH